MRQRLSDPIHIALPAEAAFQLFTPRGEREWAGDGWNPTFPAPTSDDSEPGTVFETDAHGRRTTWQARDQRAPRYRKATTTPSVSRSVSGTQQF